MLRDIERTDANVRRRYVNSPRHTIQVDFYPYLAELAKEREAGRSRPRQTREASVSQSTRLRRAA